MKLTTTQNFDAAPEQLWPLLFNSKMDEEQPCGFLCGLPKPIECRLQAEGGIGQTRECISDRGIIKQTILTWEPNHKLRFELNETDIYFGSCVKAIVETFEITALAQNKSSIKRQTEFFVKPLLKPLLSIPLLIGLKAIHRYVFKNWVRLSSTANA